MVKRDIEAPLGLVCFGNCRSGTVVPAQRGGAVAPAGLGGPQGPEWPQQCPGGMSWHLWAPGEALGTSKGPGPAPPCRAPLLQGHRADETESCARCFITQFPFSFLILSSVEGDYFTLFFIPHHGGCGHRPGLLSPWAPSTAPLTGAQHKPAWPGTRPVDSHVSNAETLAHLCI